MNRYRCQIRNPDGTTATIEIEAESFGNAFDLLLDRGVDIAGIQVVDPTKSYSDDNQPSSASDQHRPLDQQSQSITAMQIDLSESIHCLLPVLNATRDEVAHHSVKRSLGAIAKTLEEKKHLGELLRDPQTSQAVPLLLQIRAGRANAESILNWLNDRIEEYGVPERRWFHYTYPLIMLGLSGIIFVFCSIVVFPIFSEMYDEFELALPASTSLILNAGRQVTHHGLRTAIITSIVILGIFLLGRMVGSRLSTIPLLGRLFRGNNKQLLAISRFTSILSELILQVPDSSTAIRIANQACQERSLHLAIRELANRIEQDPEWANYPNPGPGVPATVVYALAKVPSPTSKSAVLRRMSEIYRRRSNYRLNLLETIFPTIATLLVGVLSAFIAIQLFAPLLSLVSSLSGW